MRNNKKKFDNKIKITLEDKENKNNVQPKIAHVSLEVHDSSLSPKSNYGGK